MIKLLRVDYRLVHGQVAISWSRHIGADCILVANDEVAKDEMRQSMLRLSKPQGILNPVAQYADRRDRALCPQPDHLVAIRPE